MTYAYVELDKVPRRNMILYLNQHASLYKPFISL